MISSLAAIFVLSPSLPEGQWGPTTLTPNALAAKVDRRLATLPRARLNYQYSYVKEAVGQGFIDCQGTIVSPGVFRVELPNVDPNRRSVIERETWISDGRRFGAAVSTPPVPGPLARRPSVPAKPASSWFTDFSRVILSGIGRSSHPMVSFVSDARRQRYKASVNYRQIRVVGKLHRSYRLVVAKGLARYETIIDADFLVPTSIVNIIGKTDNTRWSAVKWSFPNKPIDPSVVAFKKSAQATARVPAPPRRKASPSR